jgi:hypothetical protein
MLEQLRLSSRVKFPPAASYSIEKSQLEINDLAMVPHYGRAGINGSAEAYARA